MKKDIKKIDEALTIIEQQICILESEIRQDEISQYTQRVVELVTAWANLWRWYIKIVKGGS